MNLLSAKAWCQKLVVFQVAVNVIEDNMMNIN